MGGVKLLTLPWGRRYDHTFFFKTTAKDGVRITSLHSEFRRFITASWKLLGGGNYPLPLVRQGLKKKILQHRLLNIKLQASDDGEIFCEIKRSQLLALQTVLVIISDQFI